MKQGERSVSVVVCDQTVMLPARGCSGGQQEVQVSPKCSSLDVTPQCEKLQANFVVHKVDP